MNVQILTPKDRAAWLKARSHDVTASAVGALFGCHDFLTRYELAMLKSGRIKEDPTETPAMRRGRLLEPVAVQLIRETNPTLQITHNSENRYWRDAEARLGATPDVLAKCPVRGPGIIQIKSVGEGAYRRKWLVEGEPEAPLWIALQATLEAHLTGARWAAVAPLVVGYGVECPLIGIDLLPGVVDAIRARVAEFWAQVDADEIPEPDPERDGALIDCLHAYGDPLEEVDLSTDNRIPELIAEAQAARADLKVAQARISAAEAEIKAKMGLAEVAHLGMGRRITWKTRRRAGFTAPPTNFRVLTLPAAD